MIRGEYNCAQHRSKAQHWTQTKGKDTQGALNGPREPQGRKQKCFWMTRLGIFSSTKSAMILVYRRKQHNTLKTGKNMITAKGTNCSPLKCSFSSCLVQHNCFKRILYSVGWSKGSMSVKVSRKRLSAPIKTWTRWISVLLLICVNMAQTLHWVAHISRLHLSQVVNLVTDRINKSESLMKQKY